MASGGFGPYLNGPLWTGSGMSGTEDQHGGGELSPVLSPGLSPGMHSEEERLRSFEHWATDSPVSPADLARAGFYFLGYGDTVQCFCCDGVLRCWVSGDEPLREHKRHFPTCGFILGRSVGNIPRPPGSPDSVDGQLLSQLQRMGVDEQVSVGQAVYPEMEAEDTRLTTFQNWPPGASVQPDTLAQAGFFYTGHGDNVKCFFCDGGLRNWEPGDDPWQEHAKWFPRCEYLLQTRGREYVNNIQQSHFNMSEMSGSQTPAAGNIPTGHEVLSGQSAVVAAMLSPVVQTALQMGFQRALVESLVQSRYLLTGHHYTSVSDLVADVLQAEEEERQGSQSRPEPVVRQGGSTGEVRTQTSVGEKVTGNLSAEEQLRQLQEERTCKVCMDKLVSMVFIPCGHLVVCTDCAASLRHCPICRAVIRGSVRAFMS
ncbi:baculoviral IAP repeat-containing protein 7 isoform X1 [Astyanax mexicanus]|uniref:RING-type E3 ubiquitin transferase n=1 Tax=Astyanax mexicanus TaxID=7994 RepID=A0A8B9KMX0_ASTMX|nr:baculoviral IAP repeat-containing protein 7 isoform X1 [Astyanax mexicanus]KAG9269306.1 baculoviral IAP repeat-containing protein 7 isoform X1 [Astyanax mexicanus]